MKSGKYLRSLAMVLLVVLIATVAVAIPVVRHLSARNAEQEYRDDFGLEVPETKNLASIQAKEVAPDLELFASRKNDAFGDYKAFQMNVTQSATTSTPEEEKRRQDQLRQFRETYQAAEERFSSACWVAHHYGIPAKFPAECNEHF